MTQRSFDFFYHTPRPGFLSGANILDIGKIGIYNGLLTLNDTILHDAFFEVHNEISIHNTPKGDGIRADGSFGQHAGVLYNGNYGKDLYVCSQIIVFVFVLISSAVQMIS